MMTNEEVIHALDALVESYGIAIRALRDQCDINRVDFDTVKPAKLDRRRREGCETCNNTPGIMLGEITMCIGKRILTTESHEFKYCPECGSPLTEEAWAELKKRGEVDNETD